MQYGNSFKAEFGGFITGDEKRGYTYTFRSDGLAAFVYAGPIPEQGGATYHNHIVLRTLEGSTNVGDGDFVASALRGGQIDVMVTPDGYLQKYRGLPTPQFREKVESFGGVKKIWEDPNFSADKLSPYVEIRSSVIYGRVR